MRLPPKLHTVYDPPVDPGIDFTSLQEVLDPKTGEITMEVLPEKSLTEQCHKDSCDINLILERYSRGALDLATLIKEDGRFGDFSSVPSYQESLDLVNHANEQFANLDAAIRKRFGNDPMEFLAFASDQKNGPEMVKLGLAKNRDAPPATLDTVVAALKASPRDDRPGEAPGSPSPSPSVPGEPQPVKKGSK